MKDSELLKKLIDKYWDIAFCEGRDADENDEENYNAQYCRSGIEALIEKLDS